MFGKYFSNSFLLYLMVEILQLVHEKQRRALQKRRSKKLLKILRKTQDAVTRWSFVNRCSKMFCRIHWKNIFASVSLSTKLHTGDLKPKQAAAGDGL